ncbi:MAG: hypothetical protein AB1696_27410 [Planctomycetota bacterium]
MSDDAAYEVRLSRWLLLMLIAVGLLFVWAGLEIGFLHMVFDVLLPDAAEGLHESPAGRRCGRRAAVYAVADRNSKGQTFISSLAVGAYRNDIDRLWQCGGNCGAD